MSQHTLHPLADKLSTLVNTSYESGHFLQNVTPTTADLIRLWFGQGFVDERAATHQPNFHEGQRQAILNTIYCDEIIGSTRIHDVYQHVDPQLEIETGIASQLLEMNEYVFPSYCMKMATGTGKTRVLNSLIIRQYLNACEGHAGFTKNFLIIAPGLIVYERLLDSLMGKIDSETNQRDVMTSDMLTFEGLFVPQHHRERIIGLLQTHTITKENIGRSIMGDGQIMITNRHALNPTDLDDKEKEDTDPFDAPADVRKSVIPLTPGISTGNDSARLDAQFLKGTSLHYCRQLSSLMVFNDEAHHLGSGKDIKLRQHAINEISVDKEFFVQVDFSATPYVEKGKKKMYFPHIITDFTLTNAIQSGLVKCISLSERKTFDSLSDEELEFKAVRDDRNKVIALSGGQKLMIDAGLHKLHILEEQFADTTKIEQIKHPKMLIMCEDTLVIPYITEYLKDRGYSEDEYVEIHSNKKGDIKPDERKEVKAKVFGIDKHDTPKIIISVLMLREGFDVNNICVIVPLRASESGILLEQTIGRGLRLMWREYPEMRARNREALMQKKDPDNAMDILTIVEHPKFKSFYDDLIKDGLVYEPVTEDSETSNSLGDLVTVGLRDDYADYDLFRPVVINDVEEVLQMPDFSSYTLPSLGSFADRKGKVNQGEVFRSVDIMSKTTYGDYTVETGIFHATSYNDYLSRLVQRVTEYSSDKVNKTGFGKAGSSYFPSITINPHLLASKIDHYIKHELFGETIDYLTDNNWKVLMIEVVSAHIIKHVIQMIVTLQDTTTIGEPLIHQTRLSEIDTVSVRSSYTIPVSKCIYPLVAYPSNKGLFEKAFMEFVDHDSLIQSRCKIYDHKHSMVRLRYINDDGIPASYYPDFIVKTTDHVYLIETKAKKDISNANVQRKKTSAVGYISKINNLPENLRDNRKREYVLLSDTRFYQMRDNGANIEEMVRSVIVNASDGGEQLRS